MMIKALKIKLERWHRKCVGKLIFDDHIFYTKRAAVRHERETWIRFPCTSWDCCPGCKYGKPFSGWCDKQDRRLAYLSIMLKKRGKKKDLILANKIDREIWP